MIGHSYGGTVITGAADKQSKRIAHFVYLDSFFHENGKSVSDYLPREGRDMIAQIALTKGDGWRVPCPPVKDFFDIKDNNDIRWMSARVSDQPYSTFTQSLNILTNQHQPYIKTYIQLAEDFTAASDKAKSNGFHIFKMFGGGHYAIITKPKELTNILNALVI